MVLMHSSSIEVATADGTDSDTVTLQQQVSRVMSGQSSLSVAFDHAESVEAMRSAIMLANAMIVACGLTPSPVGRSEPSTT